MSPEDIQKIVAGIKPELQDIIVATVNGKINLLTQELRNYVKEDTAWKAEYEPYIRGLANVSGGVKIIIWIIVAITAIFTFSGKVAGFFK